MSCSALNAAQPATDIAPQVARKIPPITRPSDREKTAARQPPAQTQDGEPGGACSPTRCCSSVSGPMACASLDSVDPRWTSHTVAKTYRKNCRYSDCQFSITSTANDD